MDADINVCITYQLAAGKFNIAGVQLHEWNMKMFCQQVLIICVISNHFFNYCKIIESIFFKLQFRQPFSERLQSHL